MNAIFVGCNPSFKNTDPSVPFCGTRSGEVLSGWIKTLGLSEKQYRVLNLTDKITRTQSHLKRTDIDLFGFHYDLAYLYFCVWIDLPRIIALGTMPSWALNKLKIEHFTLPHPSPRNRKLNDKKFIKEQLLICKQYLKGAP